MSRAQRTPAQIFRFAAVSSVSLAIDASVYYTLVTQFDLEGSWAKRVSFACIAIWGYFAHKHFTFRDKSPNGSEPFKFGLLYFSGWAVNSLVHDMSVTQGEASSPAFIAATFAWACWNFIGQKYFVFRNAERDDSQKPA